MTLSSGSLSRRIRIERRVAGTDAAGQPLDTWELVAELWASVKGQTGMGVIRERLQDNVEASINAYSFRIRFREDLDAGMRVVYGGRPYDIKQVRLDLDRREWTDLVCEQGGSNG